MVSRRDAAYAKLSPEEQKDWDRSERLEEIRRALHSNDTDQHERDALNVELHKLTEDIKAAHPKQAERNIAIQADWEYTRLLARQQAQARLTGGSWTPDPAGIVDARQLVIRRPDWLIADYIERGTVGLLVGPYGSAKSFIALDWSCCVATQLAWHGHRTQIANVMYVAAEGGLGLGKRRAAWEGQHRELDKEALVCYLKPLPLDNPAAVAWLKEQIKHYEIDFLIIDTIARNKGGLEENSEQDIGRLIEVMYELRDVRGENVTTVLGVHHTGKDPALGARGSSRFGSDVDFLFQVSKGDEKNPFVLRGKKVKEDELPPPWEFGLRQVEVTAAEGEDPAITSCVLQPRGELWTPPKPSGRHAEHDENEEKILTALHEAKKPLTATEIREATDLSRATVGRHLKSLAEAEPPALVRNGKTDEQPLITYGLAPAADEAE